MSSSDDARDLVTAKLQVKAPVGSSLTGGLTSGTVTGKNTGWNQVTKDSTMKYTDRVNYLSQNAQGHSLPTSMVARHIGDTAPEDKRGATCAEAGAILNAHNYMARKGVEASGPNIDAFKQSFVDHHAKRLNLPSVKPSSPWSKEGREYLALSQSIHEAANADLAEHLKFTGMSSWDEYAKAESSYMAWNDIQQHGSFTEIKHDDSSDIRAGQAMAPCEHCRNDTLSRIKAHSGD